jgi:histidinol-phosphate phosphatase family protein
MTPAFFIDRDGVINEMVRQPDGNFDSPQGPEQVTLVPGIIELINLFNSKNIPVVIITNQPAVAKGKFDIETQEMVEGRIESLLKEGSAHIDAVYQCPHHPKGVIPHLKQDCDCRKPKPGLFLRASEELGIDLAKSIFLGDNVSDMEAGAAAGCTTIFFFHENDIPEKVALKDSYQAQYRVESLREVVQLVKNILQII